MRAVIQRCAAAHVEVEGAVVGRIERGLAIFLGVAVGDTDACAEKMARKIAALRIFDDEAGRFDRSVRDIGGAVLVISNFTLCGDARKGTRPSFSSAAPPIEANRLYERFISLLQGEGVPTQAGVFGAAMQVNVDNDGPVTIVLDVEP